MERLVKVHKKKRTVVEEEIDEPAMEEAINVSYISNSHSVSPESTLGMLITNFLIHTRSPVTTNVVSYDHNGGFFSLYNMDLRASLGDLDISPQVIVARSGFENEGDAIKAVNALASYLGSIRSKMPHEDQELLKSAILYLKPREPLRAMTPRLPTVRADQGIVRESIGSSVPVVLSVPTASVRRVVAASPSRSRHTKKKTVIEEESSTSTEEEVFVRSIPAPSVRRVVAASPPRSMSRRTKKIIMEESSSTSTEEEVTGYYPRYK